MVDPMYRQIAEDLRRQIESGELSPGSQLPTEIELREKYNASRNTIRDAIKWLTTRGLVETRPGQGTFVPRTVIPFITTLTGDPKSGYPEGDPYKPERRSGGGGEGEPYYAKEVIAWRREPTASDPKVEIQVADAPLSAELELPLGGERHQPASAAVHRRHTLVPSDLVLPHGFRATRSRRTHNAGGHPQRHSRVPP